MSYKKSVIVVGNGCGVFKKENGQKIDNFDCVVRLGSCKVKGYEKYIGTKTDIYCTHVDKFFNIEKNSTTYKNYVFRTYPMDFIPKSILFVENEPDLYTEIISLGDMWGATDIPKPSVAAGNIELERIFKRSVFTSHYTHASLFNNRIVYDFFVNYLHNMLNIRDILFYNKRDRAQMFAKFNETSFDKKISYPSNGMFALDYVFNNIRDMEVCVTGFDGFKTRHYCNQTYETFFRAHNSCKEKIFYKKLLTLGKIYEL